MNECTEQESEASLFLFWIVFLLLSLLPCFLIYQKSAVLWLDSMLEGCLSQLADLPERRSDTLNQHRLLLQLLSYMKQSVSWRAWCAGSFFSCSFFLVRCLFFIALEFRGRWGDGS